ncbi:hypothetical protein SUGI_0995770 [Cryptomeria japonica]|nr:hypothetical protein SUGI_0995770 [Cryptomeria japonica]
MRLSKALSSDLGKLLLGGLAHLSATAQSCLTSSAMSTGRDCTIFSISKTNCTCGMERGEQAKLRPLFKKLNASRSKTTLERLTTSLLSQSWMERECWETLWRESHLEIWPEEMGSRLNGGGATGEMERKGSSGSQEMGSA